MAYDENIRGYLNEIGKIPLLTRAQETDLAKKMLAGSEAQTALEAAEAEGRELSREEQRKLQRAIDSGAAARKTFIESNLRLVASIARHYYTSGMTLPDLIQEGSLGLIKAVEKFDYTRGTKFSTHATWWIRQSIQRGINEKARTVRIPEDVVKDYSKIRRASQALTTATGKEPSNAKIAEMLGMERERVTEILSFFQGTVSINAPMGDEEDFGLENLLEDTNTVSPEANVDAMALSLQLEKLLDGLSDRHKQIIRLRFGLYDDHQWTLEEVGREFGLTRERIRQIETKALMKLRASKDLHLLQKSL